MSSILFSPLELKSVKLPNRIMMSPMCQYSSRDGMANEWHLVHYGSRAAGGVGLIMQEATAVSPEGRITPADLGIWTDEHIPYLQKITTFIKSQNAVPGIQLAHAGRKASTATEWEGGKSLSSKQGGWTTMGPSPIAFSEERPQPHALTIEEIHQIIRQFKAAAQRAHKAGYDIIEIHAAHGYLIHEFLSPLSNERDDEYGGSFARRIRLLEDIIDAVKEVWPSHLPIFVRISATDWLPSGWDKEQSVQLARILKEKRIDLIDVSSGGLLPHADIPIDYGYQLPFSYQIRHETQIHTATVGMITDAIQAETILQNRQADLIAMGRELLRNPYFAHRAAKKLEDCNYWPKQYLRARK